MARLTWEDAKGNKMEKKSLMLLVNSCEISLASRRSRYRDYLGLTGALNQLDRCDYSVLSGKNQLESLVQLVGHGGHQGIHQSDAALRLQT